MKSDDHVGIAITGAGMAGIATAYYLCTRHKKSSVLLIDSRPPMSFTSAQSGDNYRNWWPHPTMTAFTDLSIDLMEAIARETGNAINMKRRGYMLATRRDDIDDLIADLYAGYGETAPERIRVHSASSTYQPPVAGDWQTAPDGVDVLTDASAIQATVPAISREIRNLIHIRRAGDISGQQLGAHMLERARAIGARQLRGELKGVSGNGAFELEICTAEGTKRISADIFVNAAGPFASRVAAMLGSELPVHNVFQQKIAFEDTLGVIDRRQPFVIDLDAKQLPWSAEERELLAADDELGWLIETMPGGTHCRPEGGEHGNWVKLGWAYNRNVSDPQEDLANEPALDAQFPEIVIRGASMLLPALEAYIEKPPTRFSHYGGYYPMTDENWPLIGPMGVDGAFTVAALSGFGSMSACAAGSICADRICGSEVPGFSADLSIARYVDSALMGMLRGAANKGLL